ncbi:two-component regulator propeller domain-containing protein, partial [Candidatus Altiarchaeota archaeon]
MNFRAIAINSNFLIVALVFSILLLASFVFSSSTTQDDIGALGSWNQTYDLTTVIELMENKSEVDDITFWQGGSSVTNLDLNEPFNITVTAASQGLGNPIITISFPFGIPYDDHWYADPGAGFNLTQFDESTLTNSSVLNITRWYNLSYTNLIVGKGTNLNVYSVKIFGGDSYFTYRIELPYEDPPPLGRNKFAGIVYCPSIDGIANGTCLTGGSNNWVPLEVCNFCQNVDVSILPQNCTMGIHYSKDCSSTGFVSTYDVDPIPVYGDRGGANTAPTILWVDGSENWETAQGLEHKTYIVRGSDSDYDPLYYDWWMDDQLLDGGNLSSNFFLNSSLYLGDFNLTVIVTDSYGASINNTWENVTVHPAGRDRTWVNSKLNSTLDPNIPDDIIQIQSVLFDPAIDRCEDVDYTWYGVVRTGLDLSIIRFNETNYTLINNSNTNGKFRGAYVLAKDSDEKIWAGSQFGRLSYYDGEGWNIVWNSTDALAVMDIEVDSQGNVWVGTQNNGLYKFVGGSTNSVNYQSPNLPENDVNTIAIDNDDNIWMGVRNSSDTNQGMGVVRYNGSSWTNWHENNSDLNTSKISAIEVDNDGIAYAGTEYGVFAFDGNNWSYLDDGPNEQVLYMKYRYWSGPDLPREEDSMLWILTKDEGVVKYNGSLFTTYTEDSGLYSHDIDYGRLEITGDRVWVTYTTHVSYSQLPTATVTNPTGCVVETNRTLVVNFTITGTNISLVDHANLRLSNTSEILNPYIPHHLLNTKINTSVTIVN